MLVSFFFVIYFVDSKKHSIFALVINQSNPVIIMKSFFTTILLLCGIMMATAQQIDSNSGNNQEAQAPVPTNRDYHYDCDNGSCTLKWTSGTTAAKHRLFFGTNADEVERATNYEYEGSETEYAISNLNSMTTYYWRVDEVEEGGTVHKGQVWSFRPRHLAFPEAEGYGRFAIGGRGGVVYHVTNLSGDVNTEGSLPYGLVNIDEPRYIVFDVSGIIELDFNSYAVKPYAYIAGQTAPGKGICIKASNINIGSDVICRHMRFKRGLGVYGENTGNALELTGANHTIIDHCMAAWGTNVTVNGKDAQNISFQYNVISEALGITGHKDYADGKNHGFAATVDGCIGSWHHNLLVHCYGSNWYMDGGMDDENRPIGRLDLFNNVCYDWNSNTTDGNSHEVNFVNNYYKMGAATKQTKLITLQFEQTTDIADNRTNTAYVSGNIRENKNHTVTYDKQGDTYTATDNVPTDYEYFVNEPLFPSYATIHTAKDAMKIVTSYAGATMPMRDEHLLRNIQETLEGSYHYLGSKSRIKGQIDSEENIIEHAAGKGWEEYPEECRADNWDTDQDGMPDWWESCVGSNPSIANQNDDPDGDGWTLLEDYLEFMAHPYLVVEPNTSQSIDMKPFFSGFYGQNASYGHGTPTFSVTTESTLLTPSVEGSVLKIQANEVGGVDFVEVTVNDAQGTTWAQRFYVAVTGIPTGISTVWSEDNIEVAKREFFTTDGRKVSTLQQHGVYVMKVTDIKGNTYTMKIIKN